MRYNPIPLYLFRCSNCSKSGHRDSFRGTWAAVTCGRCCESFRSCLLTFLGHRVLQARAVGLRSSEKGGDSVCPVRPDGCPPPSCSPPRLVSLDLPPHGAVRGGLPRPSPQQPDSSSRGPRAFARGPALSLSSPSAPSSPTPPPRCACPLPCEGASSSQQSSGARVHLDVGRSHGTHFG